jgi:hypothetical protein
MESTDNDDSKGQKTTREGGCGGEGRVLYLIQNYTKFIP